MIAIARSARAARNGRTSGFSWLVLWTGCSLVAIAAAFIAGLFVRSPWDQASANAQSNPIVTDIVRERDFTPEQSWVQATVALGRKVDVPIPERDGPAVVTRRYVQPGTTVRSGMALVEVSGRPVFALAIPFGLYRTIIPGVRGPDVIAVQRALSDLGLYPAHSIDGVYGAATSRAVEALYARAQAAPPPPELELSDALRRAQQALDTTEYAVGSTRYIELLKSRNDAAANAATPLPLAEVVAIGSGAYRADSIPRVGTILTGAGQSIRLIGGRPTATGRVSVLGKDTYASGSRVIVRRAGGTSNPIRGVVTGLSEFRSNDPAGYDISIDLPTDSEGFVDGEKITFGLAKEPPKVLGLGIPLSAIREDADGRYVWIQASGRETRRVSVTLGEERAGFVRVTGGPLRVDDLVVVAGR